MQTSPTIVLALCITVLLGGCATGTPAGTGATVRAIMASQIISSEPKAASAGTDAGTAILAYKNYQGSFAAPAPQVEVTLFGKK